MAITNYKKIQDNKGYFLQDKDRQIFEREVSKGYFGFDEGDTIEFVIYDTNDNPLPQASANGKTARYIEYNSSTEQKYFGKTQLNKENIQPNQAEEFFIDTEKLLNEAGYSQGTFKTSITLLNRRLGSENRENDKVWIHEISPSRTEIRILPTIDSNGKPNIDLENRYKTFVDCGIFKADVAPFLDEFVSQFDVQTAIEEMMKLKGTISDGQNYIKLIEAEFKIKSFETFIQKVKSKFDQAIEFYKTNRDYNIFSNKFGQPISSQKITFSIDEIYDDVLNIITDCIEYHLPKRNIQEENSLTIEQQKSLDKVEKILETVTSNEEYESTIPVSVGAKVKGCKDPNALNYNPNADIHDKTMCVYLPDVDVVDIDVEEKNDDIVEFDLPDVDLSDRPRQTQEEIDIIIDERIDMAENGNTGIGAGALGGVELDLTDQNEKALFDIVTDTYNQVNQTSTKQHFEDMNNAGMGDTGLDSTTSTTAGSGGQATISAREFDTMSTSDKINTGRASSVVIDGKIKDRQVNQI